MADFQGMRWLKCDLQMQTPADSLHWIGAPLVPGKEIDAARDFAKACHEARLDVVAITDHNFLSKEFLPFLRQAFEELEVLEGHRVTLFPGFELEADVGKGIHVLCLFEPDTDLVEIDHALTECGVVPPRLEAGRLKKSTKRLTDILQIVQRPKADGTWRGIVIIPHIFESSLFDGDRINEWLQQEEYLNPNLLAVEIPKSLNKLSKGFQKLFRAGPDCTPEWRRARPVATIMSSDNKQLINRDENRHPLPNSIGFRYTWIKMSEPSIQALRQAFLDHESRIVIPEDVRTDVHPSERASHARIESISVKGAAFLADQKVVFSPNLNCVIGGRGSGKSTLLEYLRLLFAKDRDSDIDPGTQARINRVRETLVGQNVEIEANWRHADGTVERILWKDGVPEVAERQLADTETFFKGLPIKFLSQQQLNRLTEAHSEEGNIKQADRLLELIDGFAQVELEELAVQERRVRLEIREVFSRLRKVTGLDAELKRLMQELQELDRQWQARSAVQDDARRHQQLKYEAWYVDHVADIETMRDNMNQLGSALIEEHVHFDIDDSPHVDWLRQYEDKVLTAKNVFSTELQSLLSKFMNAIEEAKSKDPAWQAVKRELDLADQNFSLACAAKGLTPGDVGRLQEIDVSRTRKQQEVTRIGAEIAALRAAAGNVEDRIATLHDIWRQQYERRLEAANRANTLAVMSEGGKKFIEVSPKYQRDMRSFRELWSSFAPFDGRTRLGRSWEHLGSSLLAKFEPTHPSPWETLRILYLEQGGVGATGTFKELKDELADHIKTHLEQWHELRLSRVQDSVDMTLFRPDGTIAGRISEGSLSDGQRNTAALALLLAQEGGPLVIDQPEDELDSNFVFRELIPMLRKVKPSRQVIMATHNANLPVNGDAELVYALEAINGRGNPLAAGGLDRAPVTKAVLDIMEGTEEAFRKRREKYQF